MWGTQHSEPPTYAQQRFIPTHVGNTAWGTATISGSPVHPHACGEHHDPKPGSHGTTGSSPRMWGTPLRAEGHRHEGRFIPTHVGNTMTPSPAHTAPPVHPHACGEHPCGQKGTGMKGGSSPRMWGTRIGRPAWSLTFTVHPHACGEHRTHRYLTASFIGSSPRMWGTPEAGRRKLEAHRFIPTHVGNTVGDPPTWAWRPVHPHACGEHGVADMGTFIPGGSSPRMWGTLLAGAEAADLERFIPTHVGNTT